MSSTRTDPRRLDESSPGFAPGLFSGSSPRAARRMGSAQRNPSSRVPGPAAHSDGFRLWLYPSYDGFASVLPYRIHTIPQRVLLTRVALPYAFSYSFHFL